MDTLLTTPLHAWHKAQGAKMADFAGWDMPIQYAGILAEHEHTRTKVSLFDICHMGEFLISGDGATASLAKAVTQNFETLQPGKCRYGFLLNEQGKIIDDLITYRLEDESYMLVVNGARTEVDFAALKARLPENLKIEDVSAKTAKLDLQGPESLDVLESCFGKNFRHIGYFCFDNDIFEGENVLISRSGYTGELGYELYLPWDKALSLWEKLLQDERVKPAGLGARDTLRLECGMPLYGHELDENHTPIEAGFEKMLTSKAPFVGHENIHNVKESLLALRIEGRRAARAGDKVVLVGGDEADKEVGIITSGSFAPSLGYVIAFAWVNAAYAQNTEFAVRAVKTTLPTKVVSLPFYEKGTARIKLENK